MKKVFILVLSLCLIGVTAHGQMTKEEKKQQKAEQAEKDYEATKELVDTREFAFVALQATPLGGRRVFMNTTPNYVKINGEEGDIYLPYYGVVQAGTGYATEAGIKFQGALENYKVSLNDKKKKIVLSFEIQRGAERHELNFTIERGGSATLVVASTKRNSITYNGEISKLGDIVYK